MAKITDMRFILLAGLIFSARLWALQENQTFLPLPKGLTNNSVTSIVQDKQGYIWLGTFTGLNRYDGYEYKAFEYNLLEKNTISNSRVNDIIVDNDGNLLIGTYGGGLNIYFHSTETFKNIYLGKGADDLPANNIRKLLLTSGNLLFAATDFGLYQIINDSSILVPLASFPHLAVSSLVETQDGTIWAGTQESGLFKIKVKTDNTLTAVSVDIPGKPKSIRTLSTDYKGNLWLSYFECGFSCLRLDKDRVIGYMHGSDISGNADLENMPIQAIFCNINGEVWMGTENFGLIILEPESGTYVHNQNDASNKNSLPDNSIWSIYKDNTGIIWLGTFSHGAYRIDPFWNKFDQYAGMNKAINSTLGNTSVTSFLEKDATTLFMTTDGIKSYEYDFNSGGVKQIQTSNNVMHMALYDNKYWVSTWNNGLYIYGKNFILEKRLLETHNIFRTIKTKHGEIWVATWDDGIYIVSEKGEILHHLTTSTEENKIISLNIFSIFEDKSSRIWIGTLNGLSVISKNSDNTFTINSYISEASDSTSLSSNIVLSVYQDSDENIWIGTSNGLNKYVPNENSFTRIIKLQDNKSFEIRGILESSNHNLWLGSNKGLLKYSTLTGKARLYDEKDGLPFLEFRNNSAYKLNDNRLMFGGNGGAIVFDPSRIEDNPISPNTIITGIRIFNNPVAIGDEPIPEKSISEMKKITLSHKMNVFTLEFTAICYTHPEKNTYEYMLEGLEDNWNNVGNQRTATYSNLHAGEYIFKVRSANNDGYWDKTPATLVILVKPPFYQTWWFRVLIVFLVGILVLVVVRIRLNELKRRVLFSENMAKLEKWKRVQLELEQERKKFGSVLDEKNQELAEVNLQIAHKNEKIFTVHQQILDILPNASRENYKKLVQLRKSLEEDINQKENWKALETGINLSHDNFLQRFTEKYPKITHKDLKLVAYIRMNMSNKEIANLLNITLRSVESGRYRLRKRLDISKDINLNDFIMRF
jgi:ligand-binding sensor domain-containing protein/DNA-binding CsgD family transcriptional regulator